MEKWTEYFEYVTIDETFVFLNLTTGVVSSPRQDSRRRILVLRRSRIVTFSRLRSARNICIKNRRGHCNL